MAAEQERAGIVRHLVISISVDQHKWSFSYVVFSNTTSSAQLLGLASDTFPVGIMKEHISVPLRACKVKIYVLLELFSS